LVLFFFPAFAFADELINFEPTPSDNTAIGFMGGSNGQMSARAFVPSTDVSSFSPTLCLGIGSGAPSDDVLVEVRSDSGGSPSSTILGTVTVANADVPGSCSVPVALGTSSVSLSSSVQYWLVVERSGSLSTTDYFNVGISTSANSMKRYGSDSGSWALLSSYDFAGSLFLVTGSGPPTPTTTPTTTPLSTDAQASVWFAGLLLFFFAGYITFKMMQI